MPIIPSQRRRAPAAHTIQQIKQHSNRPPPPSLSSSSTSPQFAWTTMTTNSSRRGEHRPRREPNSAIKDHLLSSSYSKEIINLPKRICRFSAAAPSAQCIESPRRPTNYQQPPHMILDQPAQPRVGGSCSKISFPTNNAHQRRTQLSKRRQPHAHTPRRSTANQPPAPDNPCGSVRRKQRVPPPDTPYSTPRTPP